MKKYYAVEVIETEHGIETTVGRSNIKLSWADGMCGVMPVFTNKKKAQKYAGKHAIIILQKVSDDTRKINKNS